MKISQYEWLTDKYVAHRGLFDNKDIPENSVPAFLRAAEYDFGIETDVQASKDGVLVIFHDDTVDRMTGRHGKVCDFTFEELRQMRLINTDCVIPTFDEFLEAANGVNLVVEIKTHKNIGPLEREVYEKLKKYSGNYCVESFDPFVIRWFKLNTPEVIRGQLSCSFKGSTLGRFKEYLLRNLKFSKWNGSQFIAYDADTVKKCRAVKKYFKKMPVLCWTVKSQQQLDELAPYCDNVIFDSFVPIRKDLGKK